MLGRIKEVAELQIKYAGIGARKTPQIILEKMEEFAYECALRGFILRTGNAEGADLAFLNGASKVDNKLIELHLPWTGFRKSEVREGNTVFVTGFDPEARRIAAEHHPAWDSCSKHARALHGRNTTIIMGASYDDPVDFMD